MDLSLTDALTDGVVPQTGSENLLQRDFVAALEAESYDDKVGETVGKTEYHPLLDNDGKKEGSGMMPSGQTPQNQDMQGDMWSFQTEQQVMNADFLSGPVSVGGFPGQWGTQPMVPEVKASSLTDPFTGFTQQGMDIMNMDVGMAPLPTARPPSMAEPQQPSPLIASVPPKLAQMPYKPNDLNPFESPLDILSAPDTTAVKTEKANKPENVEKMDSFPKTEKLDMPEKTDEPEKMDTPEKAEKINSSPMIEKVDVFEKRGEWEKVDKAHEFQKEDKEGKWEKEKTEKDKAEKDKTEKDKTEKDEPEKENIEKDKAEKEKTEKDKTEKEKSEKDKTEKEKAEKGKTEKGEPKKDKPEKVDQQKMGKATEKPLKKENGLKTSKAPEKVTAKAAGKPAAAAGTRAALGKDLPSSDKKTKTERLPPAPKANTAKSSAPKNGSSSTTASKAPGAPRVPLSNRTSGSAPSLRRSTLPKTENKASETKKLSTLKSTTADSNRPRTSPGTGVSSTARTRPTKPPTPTSAAPDRKPLVPRAPRSSARPSTAPSPDIKNIRSKIGSTDNMKHQPGGGKGSSAQGRTDALAQSSLSKETSQGKIQILNKKVDLSKVSSKCGSKDNIKHKPGGGDVKIQSHKVNSKVSSKVGSMDNVNHESKDNLAKGDVAPSSGAPDTEPESTAQDNGLKLTANLGDGFWDPQALDTRIPETN